MTFRVIPDRCVARSSVFMPRVFLFFFGGVFGRRALFSFCFSVSWFGFCCVLGRRGKSWTRIFFSFGDVFPASTSPPADIFRRTSSHFLESNRTITQLGCYRILFGFIQPNWFQLVRLAMNYS